MNELSQFFVRNIIPVYLLYGLAFFSMGLALLLAGRRTSAFRFAAAIVPLAWFGILHGVHEWAEMFQKVASLSSGYAPGIVEEIGRILVLVVSFLLLFAFGMMLLSDTEIGFRQLIVPLGTLTLIWLAGSFAAWLLLKPGPRETVAISDVLARYALGIPAALLGTWALMQQQRTFRMHDMPQFGRDLIWAATALFLYGVFGQIFVRQTIVVPSNVINSFVFLQWFGIPVQLFRGVMAAGLTFFMVRALNAFEVESQRRLDAALADRVEAQRVKIETERQNRLEIERLYGEVQQREALLGNLLHQAVEAQEAERQRIARELHDTTGQSLTAIGLGLKGLEGLLDKEDPAVGTARQIGSYSVEALSELRHIIEDLRPFHLDDLGLAPALRWYARIFTERWGIPCSLSTRGDVKRLPPDYEIVLFRISQEALTNVAKHSQATEAEILLDFDTDRVRLEVKDNGQGFEVGEVMTNSGPTKGWGLLGMQERATLVGGQVEIDSAVGQGTCVRVLVPLMMEHGGNDETITSG